MFMDFYAYIYRAVLRRKWKTDKKIPTEMFFGPLLYTQNLNKIDCGWNLWELRRKSMKANIFESVITSWVSGSGEYCSFQEMMRFILQDTMSSQHNAVEEIDEIWTYFVSVSLSFIWNFKKVCPVKFHSSFEIKSKWW